MYSALRSSFYALYKCVFIIIIIYYDVFCASQIYNIWNYVWFITKTAKLS